MEWLKANWKKIVAGLAIAVAVWILGAITGGSIRGCIDKGIVKEAVKD